MNNLNSQNKVWVAALIIAPILPVLLYIAGTLEISSLTKIGIGGAAATAVLVMFADALPHDLKHKLVFLRLKNELPGHRCEELCTADPRLEANKLKQQWPEVFGAGTSEENRNARWYQHIYKPVQDKPSVQSANQKFLLYRDATAGTLVLFIILTIAAIFEQPDSLLRPWIKIMASFEGMLLLFYWWNAALHGKRMVVNAVVAADKSENRPSGDNE